MQTMGQCPGRLVHNLQPGQHMRSQHEVQWLTCRSGPFSTGSLLTHTMGLLLMGAAAGMLVQALGMTLEVLTVAMMTMCGGTTNETRALRQGRVRSTRRHVNPATGNSR